MVYDINGPMPRGLAKCTRGHIYSDVLGSRCPYCPEDDDFVYYGIDFSEEEDATAYTVMEGKEIKETGLVCKNCQKSETDVKVFECTNCGFKSILCEDCITNHILNEHT
jgi:ribosomal protein L37E